MEPNPYASPRTDSLPLSPSSSSPADLERRVAELERQVAQSWLLRPSFLTRVVAVWAYLVVGYLMLLAIILPCVLLIERLSGTRW